MLGPRIVVFEAVIMLSCCLLLFSLLYLLSLHKSIVLCPRIVVFEAVIMLSCCLLFSLFYVLSSR